MGVGSWVMLPASQCFSLVIHTAEQSGVFLEDPMERTGKKLSQLTGALGCWCCKMPGCSPSVLTLSGSLHEVGTDFITFLYTHLLYMPK